MRFGLVRVHLPLAPQRGFKPISLGHESITPTIEQDCIANAHLHFISIVWDFSLINFHLAFTLTSLSLLLSDFSLFPSTSDLLCIPSFSLQFIYLSITSPSLSLFPLNAGNLSISDWAYFVHFHNYKTSLSVSNILSFFFYSLISLSKSFNLSSVSSGSFVDAVADDADDADDAKERRLLSLSLFLCFSLFLIQVATFQTRRFRNVVFSEKIWRRVSLFSR